jgi:uncharacterized protein
MKTKLLLFLFTIPFLGYAQMENMFYYPSKKLDSINVPHKELNFFIGSDTLNTILVTSKKRNNKTTFIYFHGAGGNITKYVKYIIPLTRAGYQVLMVDLRGYGKSTGKLTHQNAVSDATFIFNEIQKSKDFKNHQFIVYGTSMGTQVATKFAEDNQEKLKGLILDGCLSSLTDIAAESSPEAHRPFIYKNLVFPYSAKKNIKNVKIPVLLIHSEEDTDIPVRHAREVFQNANEPKKLWIYKGKHLEAPLVDEGMFIDNVKLMIKRTK